MSVRILVGDCIEKMKELPGRSVNCCVTSPPYFGLRDYGHDDQIGLETTPKAYVQKMVEVFREVRRVLRDDGTLWLNLGDSYATGAGKAISPGGGKQGERFLESGPSGYRGAHDISGKHATNTSIPTFQPNRMPIEGLKPKDLIGIPWRVAFALQEDGWYLRQDIIWSKPNPMPESVKDRCTKSHEYIFLLAKLERYYFDSGAMQEPAKYGAKGAEFHTGKTAQHQLGRSSVKPRSKRDSFKRENSKRAQVIPGQTVGTHRPDRDESGWNVSNRNRRSVWTVPTQPFKEAHFATFPPKLIEPCILAGCPEGGTVIDPFGGAGTTGLVASRHGRNAILCELNPEYAEMAKRRIFNDSPLLADVA